MCHPRCEHPPSQAGYREGFIKDTSFMNAKSGREVLKCAHLPKTLQQDMTLISSAWFRVTSPSICPFTQVTSSHMGGRSAPPDTLHEKQRYISERTTTLPAGALGDGKGRADPTPAAINP